MILLSYAKQRTKVKICPALFTNDYRDIESYCDLKEQVCMLEHMNDGHIKISLKYLDLPSSL